MAVILFIDDDDDFREAISTIMSSAGHEVVALKDSRYLQKALTDRVFDVAIVDYYIPSENGISIYKKLKKHKTAKGIPIIMISSHENIKPILKSNGIKNFVPKPFDPNLLLSEVNRLT